jgi:hypothetical protein
MPLTGLWMAARIPAGRGKGAGLAVLPAAGRGRRRGAGDAHPVDEIIYPHEPA